MSFVVEVTYGTRKHQAYATVPERESAEKLKEVAISKGYKDATVVTEADFLARQNQVGRSQAGTRRAA